MFVLIELNVNLLHKFSSNSVIEEINFIVQITFNQHCFVQNCSLQLTYPAPQYIPIFEHVIGVIAKWKNFLLSDVSTEFYLVKIRDLSRLDLSIINDENSVTLGNQNYFIWKRNSEVNSNVRKHNLIFHTSGLFHHMCPSEYPSK